MNNKKSIDMCNGPLLKKIIMFTIPVILSGILQLLFNAMDMVVIGRFAGKTSLAAVGSTTSLINLITNLFIGFSVSSGILVSHAIGAGKKEDLSKILHTSVLTSIISGFIVLIIGVILSKNILLSMETPSDVINKASLYLKIIFLGMPVNMLYNFCASMLRSTGDTKRPLIYLIIAGIINVILNVILVTVFNLDVAGVAIATVISQAVSAILIVINLIKGNEYLKLDIKKVRINKNELLKIIKIGLPAGLQSTMFSLSNVLIQSSINIFGTVAIAGNSAAANIEGFVYVVQNSFYQATITFVGQNMGAKKYSRITKIMFLCHAMVIIIGVTLGNLVFIFGREILSIYCPGELVSIEFGMKRLAVICVGYFMCGMMEVMTGTLRGMGYSFISMVVSLIGVCVFRVFWVFFIFPIFESLNCLYYSYWISWIMVTFIDIIIYCFIRKRLGKIKN